MMDVGQRGDMSIEDEAQLKRSVVKGQGSAKDKAAIRRDGEGMSRPGPPPPQLRRCRGVALDVPRARPAPPPPVRATPGAIVRGGVHASSYDADLGHRRAVRQFTENEDQNFKMFNYLNELNMEIEKGEEASPSSSSSPRSTEARTRARRLSASG